MTRRHDDQVGDARPEERPDAVPGLGEELRRLLGPHGDLEGRTVEGVNRRLRAGSAGSLTFELLGVGWRTAQLLLSERPSGADGEQGDSDG